ncbi:hypothetical protein BRADI_1g65433v3 [Brachypodium distachyon]|uniref:Zinc finger GRF-type domain-containing protein n=1 Tax=Brachypodium distachyon TaxID=15368 RepID=A0A2K2DTJ0_BRADI|nr:hypothetical protein BRADI_1g65433v3 [Brachypodium distachyon]
MSSSGSAASSGRGWGRSTVGERRSPVPYREDPMEYQPVKYCLCGVKAPRWISWSPRNPGRRYHACVDALIGGCGYMEWHDGRTTPFLRQLLLDLCNAVWAARSQVNVAPMEAQSRNMEG